MDSIAKGELYLSYENDYLSLEDIMAAQIKIPCKTNVEIAGFGFLDPSLDTLNLPKGSKLDLPVWAVHTMAKKTRGFITAEVPAKYKKHYRDIVRADPTILDLNKWGPYYYRSGIHIVGLPVKDNDSIRRILVYLFQKRIQRLSLTYSYMTKLHSVHEATSHYRTGNVLREHFLDNLEHRVYRDAQKGATTFQKWMETPSRPLL